MWTAGRPLSAPADLPNITPPRFSIQDLSVWSNGKCIGWSECALSPASFFFSLVESDEWLLCLMHGKERQQVSGCGTHSGCLTTTATNFPGDDIPEIYPIFLSFCQSVCLFLCLIVTKKTCLIYFLFSFVLSHAWNILMLFHNEKLILVIIKGM